VKYLLSFNGYLNEKSTNALKDRIATIFEQRDFATLTVLFSTDGGQTADGIALYNYLRSLPKPFALHATGHIQSMGVPVFMGASKRTAAPTARFFFHNYIWTFQGSQTLDGIEQAKIQLTHDISLSRKIVESRTRISSARLDVLYGNSPIPTIIGPEEAIGLGIIDEIVDLNPTGELQPDTVMWTVDWAP
jgi:ATP-dependent Clp protease protease subunit